MLLSFLLFISAVHANVCQFDEIPLKEKISSSDMIFIGEVISDNPMDKPNAKMDRVATVKVERVFKGDPGKEVQVYYRKREDGRVDDECNGKVFRGFSYSLAHASRKKSLFYTRQIDNVQTTSDDRFGGSIRGSEIKKEIKVLEEKSRSN